ncbi:MAG: anhydro-N-acetylmuramic acid kinase [Acidobacteria bacterium]|nr:anhydro-N-acetylmuramic acid kinase [Acidobacteriota bacterium]MCL5286626.1 anhydro-N-acetylmuramic acid kinase [Acidobacteriota bacterium]
MSGTSADGIDVALTRISGKPPRLKAKLENFLAVDFPAEVRATILRIAEGSPTTTAEISQLNFLLGELFAAAALRACKKFRVSPTRIALIGSHGQTIYHQGAPGPFLGAKVASTLQIGEPAVIAARTGIPVVADFRPADMAAGGQGAPLVPFVDYLLYRDARRGRVALNIGGIANLTAIPAAATPKKVFAFDTGPGNMLLDALVREFSHGAQSFDRDARLAQRGILLPALLRELLADPYFKRRPPKSCGREQYGELYAQRVLAWGRKNKARPEDLLRTATMLTAISIVDALQRFVLRRHKIHELIISGGGAHNPLIRAQLESGLPGVRLVPSAALGVPEDAKEAFAFAILAYETWHHRPANLPSATGARRPALLGKICFPPPA